MRTLSWFEVLLHAFAAAFPIGLAVMIMAPVDFMQALGTLITGTGLVGMWVSALGLKLEHPDRWQSIKGSLRRMTAFGAPATGIVDER